MCTRDSDLTKVTEKSVKIDKGSERPSTSLTETNIADVHGTVRGNRRMTICELSEDVEIRYSSFQSVITDHVDMRHACEKIMTKPIQADQLDDRASAARS